MMVSPRRHAQQTITQLYHCSSINTLPSYHVDVDIINAGGGL